MGCNYKPFGGLCLTPNTLSNSPKDKTLGINYMKEPILSTSYLDSYFLVDMDLGMVKHQGHSALLRG
ncbi:hypothetical protein Mic7113_6640 (plasmid) [Allocoleopsis franciscana PCC 7113]|uniref:Uncharacterized protein n=1 Tax=Allocoleopsis franciscana PCC 7113 TaxID=1173027 RepID=K9WPV5_9CYAN|nr:hypothetical protein Mic7113_6640 [Allocoleopsis franciscana PCC 7113]